ncbi:hypothetical protein L1049_005146 [Liquidambar formosana]|uniref:WIYLD domain-containing protein n=1 Tax=Liquidambar formosana TaxID=63359 RepID=A0AAP0WXG4_LIQFO
MAPNPRVAAAFRAMRDLGISEEIVKPVLKNLLKLYDKNWQLIEEENYRALADAIFDYEETKEAEQKKKSKTINQEEDLEEEAQVHDEPERPLKRLRLRYQEGQVSPSLGNNSNPRQSQDITESSQVNVGNLRVVDSQPVSSPTHLRNRGKQPVSPKSLAVQERSDLSQPCATVHPCATKRTESDSLSPQIRIRDKGKEPLSPQIPPREKRLFSERSSHAVRFKEPKVEPGIVLLPKKKVPDAHALIKPKNEPFTDDMPQFEVPIAIIPPDPVCQGGSSIGNDSTGKPDGLDPSVSQCANGKDKHVPASSHERITNYELANIPEESSPNLEIASSPMGEVKISLSCNSAIGRP